MSRFEFRSVPLQYTAVVRVTTSPDAIGQTMGPAFAAAFAALGKAGIAPGGPACCKYTAFSKDSVSFEAGVPVATPFPGDGEVVGSEVGGCMAAVGVHVGPYARLVETYDQMRAWLEGQGMKPSTMMWESYLDDPDSTAQEELRTEIYWPAEEE
jgi:effector-binding domain-containing protein